MRIVEPVRDVGLGVAEIGDVLVRRQRRVAPAATRIVEPGIAPDQNKPGDGIARRPIDRPILQRAQTGFLKRLFGPVEIAKVANERADRLRARRSLQRIIPGDIGHEALPCGR